MKMLFQPKNWCFLLSLTFFLATNTSKAQAKSPQNYNDMAQAVKDVLVAAVPPMHQERENWGNTKTKKKLKIRAKGLKFRVKREEKEVKHGKWREVRITPLDPANRMNVRITHMRAVRQDLMGFRLHLDIPFHALARVVHWNNGMKLISLSVEADATIDVILDIHIMHKVKGSPYLPDLILIPRVKKAQVKLRDFDLKRVGRVIKGDAAEEIGRWVRRKFLDKMIADQAIKLKTEANKAIKKHTDNGRLVLSPSTALHDELGKAFDFDSFSLPQPATPAKSAGGKKKPSAKTAKGKSKTPAKSKAVAKQDDSLFPKAWGNWLP